MRKALLLMTITAAALAAALWRAPAPAWFPDSERARLRAHFDSVERELRAQDVPGLTPTRRAARIRLLDILRSYRLRGVFPRNTDFPDRDMPTFIDYWGRRCGVAYLMEQTGNEDMVLRLGATRNYARVPELKDDPEVGRWLAANGITLAEATRIQPTYGCGTIHGGPCPASTGYQLTTGLLVASNVTTFMVNAVHASAASEVAAFGTGVLGVIVGAPNVGASGDRGTLGLLNTGVGAVSLAFDLVRVVSNGPTETPSRLRVAPWVGPRAARGLVAHVAF